LQIYKKKIVARSGIISNGLNSLKGMWETTHEKFKICFTKQLAKVILLWNSEHVLPTL
jgi:hypothetical protein